MSDWLGVPFRRKSALALGNREADDDRIVIGSGIPADARGFEDPYAAADKDMIDGDLGQAKPCRPGWQAGEPVHAAAIGKSAQQARERCRVEIAGDDVRTFDLIEKPRQLLNLPELDTLLRKTGSMDANDGEAGEFGAEADPDERWPFPWSAPLDIREWKPGDHGELTLGYAGAVGRIRIA